MNWNIPQISGQPLQIPIGVDGRLFIVGANGSGKSALIQHFVSTKQNRKVRRISAHRQTWFSSGSIDLTPHDRRRFDQQFMLHEPHFESRWRNAAIIAATVLTVEPETVLLIDEPERHLHRSIIEPFLSALFDRRQDCAFIVSTHEIALPRCQPEGARDDPRKLARLPAQGLYT